MRKLEQIGVNYQYTAATKEAAIKSFNISCNICCYKGMRIECDRCAISEAHGLIMACFEERKTK
jgi:hypothetical protein